MLYGFQVLFCKVRSSRWTGYRSVVLAVIIGLVALAVSSHKIGFPALF